MEKSNLTPDPVRDPPVGKYQCPGGHMILPARAYGDERFNQYPMTFRCFAICCAHANSWTGVFFVNQATISRILGSSQQAISQHMTRLRSMVTWRNYAMQISEESMEGRELYGELYMIQG